MSEYEHSIIRLIVASLLFIVIVVSACAGCSSGIETYKNNENENATRLDDNGRFHVVSREWCNGTVWAVIQDVNTDQLYLQVGDNRPERIDQ